MRQGQGLKGSWPAQAKRRHELGGSRSCRREPWQDWLGSARGSPEICSSQETWPVSHVSSHHWGEAPNKAILKHTSPVGSAPVSPQHFFSFAPYTSAWRPVFLQHIASWAASHRCALCWEHPLPAVSRALTSFSCSLWEVCKVNHTLICPIGPCNWPVVFGSCLSSPFRLRTRQGLRPCLSTQQPQLPARGLACR